MRIGTLNAHSGRRARDGQVDTDLLVASARSLGCDVLALQEVDRGQDRSHGIDQAAAVAEALGADHRFAATLAGVPGGRWVPATGEDVGPTYGIALVSRLPLLAWEVVPLPPLPAYLPVRLPVPVPGRLPLLVKEEPRVALVALVDAPGGPVTVATTHLSFVPGWSGHQLRFLVRRLRAGDARPVVLAGDLNLGPRAAARATAMEPLVQVATWPAHRPARQLDHLLAAGLAPGSVVSARAVRTEVSDHLALVADLALEQNLNSQTYERMRPGGTP